MKSRGVPIVGHPSAKIWPLELGVRDLRIVFWQPAPTDRCKDFGVSSGDICETRAVHFSHRMVVSNDGTPFEFLAPRTWTYCEALRCAFTGEQPKGKEVYHADDDA